MKSKPFQIGIMILVILAIVIIFFLVHKRAQAPARNSSPENNSQTQSANLVSIPPTQVSIAASTNIYSVTGSYPQFSQASAIFNQEIANGFASDVSQFETSSMADYSERKTTMSAADFKSFYGGTSQVYTFDLTSTVVQSNANYVSVVFHENEYTGGAHPFSNIVTYNFDVKNNKELSLTDFMSLADASSAAKAQLSPRLASANSEASLDSDAESMLDQGTDPTVADNFDAFTFTPASITIYFGEYQVAPYVDGEQDVTIPRN